MSERAFGQDEHVKAAVARLWARSRPMVEQRLDLLAQAGSADGLRADWLSDARTVAHKLAGSLGMFGFTEATPIARKLEEVLGVDEPELGEVVELTGKLRRVLFRADE